MHLRLALPALLALLLPSAVAAQLPQAPGTREPPPILVVIPPLTAFPDPLAISLAANLPGHLTVEAGLSALAPGAFGRAGFAVPVGGGTEDGIDVLAYGGYRLVALPMIAAVHGPTAGFGVRRWKRANWGFQLNAGLWLTNAEVDCVGDCSFGPRNRIVLPEVRLAAIRAL